MALIEATELFKIYQRGDIAVTALVGVSLCIEQGEFVAVLGPSGSGKSTLLNILGCLDTPTSGHYRLDGIDVTTITKDERAGIRNKKIGWVFQGFNLLPWISAIKNVEIPMLYNGISATQRRRRSLSALKTVGLEGKEQYRTNQLSGGEQQRVAIARCLVNEAPVLLADEPTGNLDTKTSADIMDLLLRLNRESHTTVVLATHEQYIAEYGTRVLRFLDGHTTDDELLSTP